MILSPSSPNARSLGPRSRPSDPLWYLLTRQFGKSKKKTRVERNPRQNHEYDAINHLAQSSCWARPLTQLILDRLSY